VGGHDAATTKYLSVGQFKGGGDVWFEFRARIGAHRATMMTSTTVQAPASARERAPRSVSFTNSASYFIGLLLVAVVAFWPSYLSTLSTASGYTHLHAVTAATWMLMLVVQPLAIRNRQLGWHRALGRASYAVAPLVVISMVLLAHSKMPNAPASELPGFYVPLSLAGLFALSYVLAIINRRTIALHARFMVCTALTLIDPVGVRLL
jgi:hypothetical protein